MSGPADLAETLVRRVGALADPAMRVAYLRHELGQLDPGEVAALVLLVASRAEARDGPFGMLMLSISLALAAPAAAELRQAVVTAAAMQGQHEVARLLEERAPRPGADEDFRLPDFGLGRPPTLGERKALARSSDRELLARVLRDPHPGVIEILLTNPHLTEDDLIRLCARRPIPPEVLRAVFRSPRWVVRYRVRRAMVRNPWCPLDVALQLTAHLNARDARQIAASPEVADEIRRSCKRVAGDEVVH